MLGVSAEWKGANYKWAYILIQATGVLYKPETA
jgi:hypothetical protein